jgi:hypothetical protein
MCLLWHVGRKGIMSGEERGRGGYARGVEEKEKKVHVLYIRSL